MRFRRIIPIVLTVALLAAALYAFRDDLSFNHMAARIAAADLGYLAIATACFLVGFAGAVLRYKFILDRATGSAVSFTYLFLLSNFSYLCGYLAPMSVAAEILRMGFTKSHLGISYAQSVRYIVIDKLLGLGAVAACVLIAVPFKLGHGISRELIIVETLLAIGLLAASPFALWLGPRMLARVPGLRGLTQAMIEDWRFVADNFSATGDFMRLVAYSLLAVGGFACGVLYVAYALGFNVDGGLVLAMSPTILLVQNAPFFYAGFGAREGILLVAFGAIAHADPNLVLGFSLMVGVVLFLCCTPASIAFLAYGAFTTRPNGAARAGEAKDEG
jgi:lysylphosphatidylglycerol synthase-like protein